jgi:predicted nucleic acid-binding protein
VPVVVADTGPLHYLVLIDAIDLLPRLFDKVFIPETVRNELSRAGTPGKIRDWFTAQPEWLEVRPDPQATALAMPRLGKGERAAIALAHQIAAGLILVDDRAGKLAAQAEGLEATGTLGVLQRGARRGLIDLADAFVRLKATNFRYRPEMIDEILSRFEGNTKR